MNARSTTKRARLKVLLLLAAVTLAVGVLGAPAVAGAAPNHTTSLTARSLHSMITWGRYTIVTGTLMDNTTMTALGGQWVRIEWSPKGATFSWTLLATVTTDSAQYYTGQYAAVVYPTVLTYYRFSYLGAAGYAPALSNTLLIHVRPVLGVPKVPSSAKVNKRFTVSGTLKPRFPAGAKTVTIKAFRNNGSKWVAYKTYKATNTNSGSYTKYKLSLKISKKGKYRFRARAGSSSASAPYALVTTAHSKTLKVK